MGCLTKFDELFQDNALIVRNFVFVNQVFEHQIKYRYSELPSNIKEGMKTTLLTWLQNHVSVIALAERDSDFFKSGFFRVNADGRIHLGLLDSS